MTTVRRIYAYLLAFAGLAMLTVAVANLAQVLLDVVLQAPITGNQAYMRNTIALNAAAALIGLPAWLLHWSWTERWARREQQERASSLRRLYLYVVLGASMAVIAFSLRDVLFNAVAAMSGMRFGQSTLDNVLRQLPFTIVASLVWLGHWRVSVRDRDLVGEDGGSATLRRWYVYGAAFFGLLTLLGGASGVLEAVWRMFAASSTSELEFGLAAPVAAALVGLGVWLLHWNVLLGRLPEAVRRADGVAVLRSVYLFLGLSVCVGGALFGASQLLYYVVGRLLGVDHPGGVSGDLLQAAAQPASVAVVYAAGWAFQRQAVQLQASLFAEAPRQAGIRRLYTYTVALIALGVLATGIAGLLWTLGDVLVTVSTASVGEGWRGSVALYATLAIVGLPVWLLHWRPLAPSESEAHSLARRLYVYLSLIAAMLSLIGSAAAALYRLIGLLLGDTSTVSVLTDLSHAVAVAVIAALVAVYHGRILRAGAPRSGVSVTEAPAHVVVQIRAADAAALERALSVLRSTGVEVAVVDDLAGA